MDVVAISMVSNSAAGLAPESLSHQEVLQAHRENDVERWMATESDDYVIATGETHTVREFVEAVFARLELDPDQYVAIDERYLRPTEVNALQGDPSKAKRLLGWEATTSFEQLVAMMVDSDLEQLRAAEIRPIPVWRGHLSEFFLTAQRRGVRVF